MSSPKATPFSADHSKLRPVAPSGEAAHDPQPERLHPRRSSDPLPTGRRPQTRIGLPSEAVASQASVEHRGEECSGKPAELQRRLGLGDPRRVLLLLFLLGQRGGTSQTRTGRTGGGGLLEREHRQPLPGEEDSAVSEKEGDSGRSEQTAVQVLPLEPLFSSDQQRPEAQRSCRSSGERR